MKPNGKFTIMNLRPQIQISNRDLEAIRHIVDIAPQEAQWYHTVERHKVGNVIVYEIAGMYIPEQYTSAASVETDPNMMVNFFKELREAHGPEKTNEIMSKMTCWCHSHVNMGVHPSGQDHKQFTEQCENAQRDQVENPQIMMIFNKKDQYYCRIWDPEYNLVFENVDLFETPYDFSWIDKEAKTKFKKRKIKYTASKYLKGSSYSKKSKDNNYFLDWNTSDFDEPTSSAYTSIDEFKEIYMHLKLSPSIMRSISSARIKKNHNPIIQEISLLNDSASINMLHLLLENMLHPEASILDVISKASSFSKSKTEALEEIDSMMEGATLEEIECALMVAFNLDCFDLVALLEDFDSLVISSQKIETPF